MKLSILFLIIFSSGLMAQVEGLVYWDAFSGRKGPLLVLPLLKDRSPKEVAWEYIEKLKSDVHYQNLVKDQNWEGIEFHFSELEKDGTSEGEQPRMAAIANSLNDMKGIGAGDEVRNQLILAGAQVAVIPLGLDSLLSEEEMKKFHHWVKASFDGLVALGGADIHPQLYGKEITHSYVEQLNLRRDLMEFQLINQWLDQSAGSFHGICRGHQMGGIVLGMSLIQDIPTELPNHPLEHRALSPGEQSLAKVSSWHDIEVTGEDNFLFQIAQQKKFQVNSRHHQAVIYKNHPLVRPLAFAGTFDEGEILEAMEIKDEGGFTVQFHPETMKNETGKAIMNKMVEDAKKFRSKRKRRNIKKS